jgi:DNA-binding winged helix-turn-helix (wHTH) protein
LQPVISGKSALTSPTAVTIASQTTVTAQSGFSNNDGHHEVCRATKPEGGEDIIMSIGMTSRDRRNAPRARSEVAQFLADIDGVPVLVRFLVGDAPGEMQSRSLAGDPDLHSLLSSTVEKMAGRIGASPVHPDDQSRPALATIELTSSSDHLARLPALSNDTVLRVGPLELDLLDRTARRGDRRIDLRPREFQLLKYMMRRTDKMLTREAILKDVWNYKFVPETNLVDVHMGKLRRKVDGSNEPPLICNVRGVGFILSPSSFSHGLAPRPVGRAVAWSNGTSRLGGKRAAMLTDHIGVS